ncbi:hypothetical protein BJY00DRAFT_280838 [Aspergillus carlsbadensis]|nr:hypothetical protein BJY00DRAFT_280838 [Aspergillus carlsbadensis]
MWVPTQYHDLEHQVSFFLIPYCISSASISVEIYPTSTASPNMVRFQLGLLEAMKHGTHRYLSTTNRCIHRLLEEGARIVPSYNISTTVAPSLFIVFPNEADTLGRVAPSPNLSFIMKGKNDPRRTFHLRAAPGSFLLSLLSSKKGRHPSMTESLLPSISLASAREE